MKASWVLAVVLACGLGACGGAVSGDSSPAAGGAGAGGSGTGGSPGSGAAGSGGGSVTVDAGSSPACNAAAEVLAAKLAGAGASCTVAMRLTSSLVITGYALFCGGYTKLEEEQAQDQAKADTGFGDACSTAPSLTGPSPSDEFVFLKETSYAACACCGDGWVTAVSARNGLTVFGGAVLAAGPPMGKDYPVTWEPASDLASDCGPSTPLPAARGFDFVSMASQGAKLDDATIHSALSAAWDTALPTALAKKQYVFDAVVLRHLESGQDNGFPTFIVLVNSGWLE